MIVKEKFYLQKCINFIKVQINTQKKRKKELRKMKQSKVFLCNSQYYAPQSSNIKKIIEIPQKTVNVLAQEAQATNSSGYFVKEGNKRFQTQQRFPQPVIREILKEQESIEENANWSQSHGKITIAQLHEKLRQIQNFLANNSQDQLSTEGQVPSDYQIQKSLKYLQNQFPNHDLKFMLSKLHLHVAHKCLQDKKLSQGSLLKVDSNNKQILIDNCFPAAILKNKNEKRVAQSFINQGYGLKVLRSVINDQSISPTKYNNLITTIMKNTFRTIQSTVGKLKKGVVPLGAQEERMLRAPLVNCEKWLPPDELKTFYNFIKGTCGLGQARITTASAINLYKSIIKQLQQRQRLIGVSKTDKSKLSSESNRRTNQLFRNDGT